MFNFRRLILLFSIMVMGIVGVKAEPKYAIVFDVKEDDKCCDCGVLLTQINEQSKKYRTLCPIVYYKPERKQHLMLDLGGSGIDYKIMKRISKKLYAFVVTNETIREKRCLDCTVKYAKEKGGMVKVSEINFGDIFNNMFICSMFMSKDKNVLVFANEIPDKTECLICLNCISNDEDNMKFDSCDQCRKHVKDCEICQLCCKNNTDEHDYKKGPGCKICRKFALNHKILSCAVCSTSFIHLGCSESWKKAICPTCKQTLQLRYFKLIIEVN